jgi:hypothetical protein
LGPIYRLLGDGLNDDDIAVKLNLTEVKVQALHSLDRTFPGVEEPSRVGAIRFNRSLIFLLLERRQEHEIQLKEMFWCAGSLSQPLADFDICPVL